MGDGVFALAGPWPPVPPPMPPMGAATCAVPTWRSRVQRVAWGQWVLGTLVALALVAVAAQGWVLAGVRGELRRVTAKLQASGDQPLLEKMLQEHPPPQKPAAHLIASADTPRSGNASLRWEPGLAWAFVRGLDYRGGALVCRQPGLYFVYLKVQLGGSSCPESALTRHGVHARSPRYPRELELLGSTVRHCPRAHAQPWTRPSFLGGLVELREGDEVFARVREPALVRVLDGSRNYFGMFMV